MQLTHEHYVQLLVALEDKAVECRRNWLVDGPNEDTFWLPRLQLLRDLQTHFESEWDNLG